MVTFPVVMAPPLLVRIMLIISTTTGFVIIVGLWKHSRRSITFRTSGSFAHTINHNEKTY